ncbi:uncharacterized protein CFAP97D2-like [Rhinichthys klamathensis goyatoka]|uniref:uncharacterized protein CFAP97D2-like n=1 Tax=Rhinichthys klamathensis goyatoka TaxID=3034132 RepID=UPI0024B4DA7D|nr:uncharacterized protein CFAP97D2-like [Rhinichthys klamathensis goyatoka]
MLHGRVSSSTTHKSYRPLKPAANWFLQQKWDQSNYEIHRDKVREAKPVVDTKGIETPAHIRHNLKKVQLQKERTSIIERDNHRLASNLSAITRSKGLVDNRNHCPQLSVNTHKKKEELLELTAENHRINQRILTQKSDYRRELWEADFEKVQQYRDKLAHYPRGETNKQV